MAAVTVVKTIGATGVFSTLQLWEDGAPANLTTAEKSAAGTFLNAAFVQGESLTFVGSGATGKLIDTDSTGAGTGTYVTYGLLTGNPAAGDVVTGGTSTATCVLSSSTPTNVGVVWEGQCQNQEFTGTTTLLTVGGSTAASDAYKHLTTVAGASFRDNANVQTNALRYNASNGCGITQSGTNVGTIVRTEAQFRTSNLQIAATGSDGRATSGATSPQFVDYCICEATIVSIGNTVGVIRGNGTTARNSVFVQRSSAADHIVGLGVADNSAFYNCTFAAGDDLATAPTCIFKDASAATITIQNCGLFAGDSTKALVSGTATYNFTTSYSDISGTSGVTQATYSSQFENVNNATRDFRLKTGANMLDTGTTDATNAATDIAGTSRPQGSAYDVGCWELVSSGIVPVLYISNQAVSRAANF